MTEPRRLGDRYELGEELGRGGMAEVHQAHDIRLGRDVAVKTLRVDLARDPTFQARFKREAQSAASLNHPSVVAVYDTGEDHAGEPPLPYIVMEYVEGTTLRDLISSGRRLLPERALEITAGVLTALDYSHRNGIIHRDIKPANVMLTPAGEVKVMDFGIARAVADTASTMTQTAAVIGTAQYLSPEQARGEPVDARSDLYSTGCLLYELLTGRPPFVGDSPVSVAYQHVREDPVPPSRLDGELPPSIDAVVLKALAKHADNRYQTAAEMREDIERAIAGRPVAATPVLLDSTQRMQPAETTQTITPPPRDGRSGRRGLVYALLALAVIAVFVLAALLGRSLFGGDGGNSTTVPDLTNLTVEQARTTLEDSRLKLGDQTPRFSTKRSGIVIDQSPAADQALDEGSTVDVTVSKGTQQIQVPDGLVGLSRDEAESALRSANLEVGDVREEDSDRPAEEVLATDPEAGTPLDKGDSVDLTVSSGKVEVPDVVGSTEANARQTLDDAGFAVDVERTPAPTESGDGTVLDQSPNGGKSRQQGSTVTIVVGTAPTEPPTETTTPPPTTETTTPPPTVTLPTTPAAGG